jgi:hypothetical protein
MAVDTWHNSCRTTATNVLAWSNAVEDFLLWSFLYDMGGQLPRVSAAEGCHAFTACPIASQNLVRPRTLANCTCWA